MLKRGMGWLPDQEDERDYTVETPVVAEVLQQLEPRRGCLYKAVPTNEMCVDLSSGFPTIQNQGEIGSCTAHAAAGLLQYTQRAAHGRVTDPSRLFMYSLARRLDGLKGDTGAHLRTMMKSLALVGAPPEEYLPYRTLDWDVHPDAFLYAIARPYAAIKYYRLDDNGTDGDLLNKVRHNLQLGLPVMFGFLVYPSIDRAEHGGHIPYPSEHERPIGGHAVVAVGYNDETRTLKIRNSWGRGWGDMGYGYLPYDYLIYGHAWDFWSLVETDYTDLSPFA